MRYGKPEKSKWMWRPLFCPVLVFYKSKIRSQALANQQYLVALGSVQEK